ncbi:hypothetical protein GQ55_3G069800 [Panicum hallii var. hallii]|uniref:Gnk2-homologous domain-containing protein n=1 Tax=Panicum hallii var. hallii TaxID=1504633 RepID=A0A2T7E6K4_9POAL|nr:hypothetical protein GQ55_3G069800 [Panicum hallii var. hallii]
MATRRPTPHGFPPHLAGVAAAAFLLLALALQAPLAAAAQDQPPPPPPWLLCGPEPVSGNYTANSTYQANINRLAATLRRNASSAAFLYATGSVGAVPDIVYALALCRGDANASACGRCVATAFRGAQEGCPLFKDAMAFYDLCQLRFCNRNFFLDDGYIVNTYILQGPQLAAPAGARARSAAGAFDATVGRLVNATADYAAENSSARFATGVVGFGDESGPRIYALAQCTPDRTVDICRTCLNTIISQLLPSYFGGRNGGGVFGVWCSFRYEVYPFFSGQPLLQLPMFVATPAAPASRRQAQTLGGRISPGTRRLIRQEARVVFGGRVMPWKARTHLGSSSVSVTSFGDIGALDLPVDCNFIALPSESSISGMQNVGYDGTWSDTVSLPSMTFTDDGAGLSAGLS